jgi:hypothetical protein
VHVLGRFLDTDELRDHLVAARVCASPYVGAFDTWPFTLDPRTCTQHGGLAGTWKVVGAGGALTGTTGEGTFSGRFLTYADRGTAGWDEAAIKGFVVGPMTGALRAWADP